MGTIYRCGRYDERYKPLKFIELHQTKTEREAISWLEENGGGIYRNLLHNVDCPIRGKNDG